MGEINHGGAGHTYIGDLTGDAIRLQEIADAFNASGLDASVDNNVRKLIWSKLFTNVSASALTGVLQCPLGFIAENKHAAYLCRRLVTEAAAVANQEGMGFDAEEELQKVLEVCRNAPNGYTSIYADLHDGRRSEVDTISGSIVKAGGRNGVPTPSHEFMVEMVHAMEDFKGDAKQ